MRYLFLLLALPILLGASAGPQVLDNLGQLRFAGGPWVSFDELDESDTWPAWDNKVRNPVLVPDFSTIGWPTESGRICVSFTSGALGEHRVIIDGRTGPDDPRPYLSVVDDGRIRFGIQTVDSIAGGTVVPGQTHTVCIDRTLGTTTLILDGQIVGISKTLPPWNWHPTVRLGSRYGGADPLGGTMALIQWRGLRLVCDMRSDTCSDGRQITTTRSTPVPCEVSPGVWGMVPADTGCYSVRGLESWAETTSYLSYGAELDRRSSWGRSGGIVVQKLTHVYRLTTNDAFSRIHQDIPPDTGAWTFSCVEDTGATTNARLSIAREVGGGGELHCNLDIVPGLQTHSCTTTFTDTPTRIVFSIRPGFGRVDVAGCWATNTDTPGRPCWGGDSPVHCAADRHTISTEGWPTKEGEICLKATVSRGDENTAVILDGRSDFVGQGPYLAVSSSGRVYWQSDGVRLNGPTFPKGTPLHICAGRLDGKLTLSVNGVSVPPIEGPALAWEPIAVLGDSVGDISQYIDGHISDLRIRGIR